MNKIRVNNSKKVTGFTLIELIISISILTLLLFTGSYTYSLLSERWNKELGQFSSSSQNAKNLINLQRLLEGSQPFIVVDEKQNPSFFFIGEENRLLAVSKSGMFSGRYPEIFRIAEIKKANGKVDLFYQSLSTQDFLLTGTNQQIEFNKQIILFSDLDEIAFNYFGWTHFLSKNSESNVDKQQQWFKRFSGIDSQIMPELFTLTLVKSGESLNITVYLDNNSERLLSPYMDNN